MSEVNEVGKQRTLYLREVKTVQTNGVSVVDVVSLHYIFTYISCQHSPPSGEYLYMVEGRSLGTDRGTSCSYWALFPTTAGA